MTNNPDVQTRGLSPIRHFMTYGWREGRDPNPLFSVRWYLSNNPDVAQAATNPLQHYLEVGESEGRPPSPRFDPRYYAQRYSDVADAGVNLLRHFLEQGSAEGRCGAPEPEMNQGEPVTDANLSVLKPLTAQPGCRFALLVCHAPGGRLKAHVPDYAKALQASGFSVVLVVMTDTSPLVPQVLLDTVSGVYVRDNRGLDFAAWAHVLRITPKLFASEALLLANDSVLPCGSIAKFRRTIDDMLSASADVVGLTDSYEAEWHIQSYLMLLKPKALGSIAFQRFIFSIRTLSSKDRVIAAYELRLGSILRGAGLACSALYPSKDRDNPTIRHWRELIMSGCPVLKLSVLQGRKPGLDLTGLGEILRSHDFDLSLVQSLQAPHPVLSLEESLTASSVWPSKAEGVLKIDYLGVWPVDSTQGATSRAYVSALWRTGIEVNLRPHLGVAGRLRTPALEVIGFEGPADVALLDIGPAHGTQIEEARRVVWQRARRRVGILRPEDIARVGARKLSCLSLDAVWLSDSTTARRPDVAPVSVMPPLANAAAIQDSLRAILAAPSRTVV